MKRISAFVKLRDFLKNIHSKDLEKYSASFDEIIHNHHQSNPWFIEENVRVAINSIAETLNEESLVKWMNNYEKKSNKVSHRAKRVGVVMAGNIPLVGFHDFLCVLISGNKFFGKLSSQDNKLLPAIAEILIEIEPDFENYIEFTEERLTSFDAIIATGSDNTSRYFEYYFGKYPNIIRKNRNAVAVFSGKETKEELKEFGKDIFMYFGLGCRNVSKLYVPEDYKFDGFFEAIFEYKDVSQYHKYMNNYEYNRSIFLLSQIKHFDNGFLLLKEDEVISSRIAVLNFEYYKNTKDVNSILKSNTEKIQCIVSNASEIDSAIPFGQTQNPQLWDYADGVDTMEFLLNL